MEDGPAVDDLAPAQPPPPNEVMGEFMDALNRIQRHNEEIEFLRTASDRAYAHLEAGRVEGLQRQERLAEGLLQQAEHAAQQGADISRLTDTVAALHVNAHRHEIADPKFPQWNGNQHTIEQWIRHLHELVVLKDLPDAKAIGYARLAMPHHCRDVLRTLPEDLTWTQFCDLCLEKFQPRHQQFQLHAQFDSLKMEGNHLQDYIHEFETLSSKLVDKSDSYLLRTFIRGLSHNYQ